MNKVAHNSFFLCCTHECRCSCASLMIYVVENVSPYKMHIICLIWNFLTIKKKKKNMHANLLLLFEMLSFVWLLIRVQRDIWGMSRCNYQLFCITLGIYAVHLSKSHKMLSCSWMSDIILRRGVLQVALIKTCGPYWSSLLGDRSHLELTTGGQSVQYTPKCIPPLSGSLGLQ